MFIVVLYCMVRSLNLAEIKLGFLYMIIYEFLCALVLYRLQTFNNLPMFDTFLFYITDT